MTDDKREIFRQTDGRRDERTNDHRAAGFTLEKLLKSGVTLEQLKAANFTATGLEAAGFTTVLNGGGTHTEQWDVVKGS